MVVSWKVTTKINNHRSGAVAIRKRHTVYRNERVEFFYILRLHFLMWQLHFFAFFYDFTGTFFASGVSY